MAESWCDLVEDMHCEMTCDSKLLKSTHHAASSMKRRLIDPRRGFFTQNETFYQQYQDMDRFWMKNSLGQVDCDWRDRYYREHLSTSSCHSSLSSPTDKPVAVSVHVIDGTSSFNSHSLTRNENYCFSETPKFNDFSPVAVSEKVEITETVEKNTRIPCSLIMEKEVDTGYCGDRSRASPNTIFDFPPFRQDDLSLSDTHQFLLSSPMAQTFPFECISPVAVGENVQDITVADRAVSHEIPTHDTFSSFMEIMSSCDYQRLFSPIRKQS